MDEINLPVCLGMGAPEGVSDFLGRAGLEVVPYAQRHHASLYVDFLGARPSGIPLLSIDLNPKPGRASRPEADFATDDWQSAACFILSHALKLQPPLLTADNDMFGLIRTATCVASSSVPVLIAGEIGSGKQTLARLIHSASRRKGSFTVLNCAALDLDSSGHDQFVLAPGAAGGTLFLSEIGELSMVAQVKLLALLEASEAKPWAAADSSVGQRHVGATNRPLGEMVERGDFRKDLYWRLNVFNIEVPPLRRRPADIPVLARHFLRQANPRRTLSPFALKMLSNYPFPGNIRELQNLVARLAIAPLQVGNHLIDASDIRRHLLIPSSQAQPSSSGWKSSREEARRDMVLRAIGACGGNRAEAARKLGITLRALQYHITKAGLSRRRRSKLAGTIFADSNNEAPMAGPFDGVGPAGVDSPIQQSKA